MTKKAIYQFYNGTEDFNFTTISLHGGDEETALEMKQKLNEYKRNYKIYYLTNPDFEYDKHRE